MAPERPQRSRRPTERQQALDAQRSRTQTSRSRGTSSQNRPASSVERPLSNREISELRAIQLQRRREEDVRLQEEIRANAAAIRAQESSDDDEPRPAHAQRRHPLRQTGEPEDDYEAFDDVFTGISHRAFDEIDTQMPDDLHNFEDNHGQQGTFSDGDDDGCSGSGTWHFRHEDEDDNTGGASMSFALDNGINAEHSPQQPHTPLRSSVRTALEHTRLRTRYSLSPRSTPVHNPRRIGRRGGVYKVTTRDFTPRSRQLVERSKREERRAVAVNDAFSADLDGQAVEAMKAAVASADPAHAAELQAALQRIVTSLDTSRLAVTYTKYGRGGLLHSLMTKARSEVPGQYGIPGKMAPSEVEEKVQWLLRQGNFKYGEVDVKTSTFNPMLPYGANIFHSIIRLEFFMTKGGANVLAFQDLLKKRRVGAPTIALVATVVEHAISEYSQGTHKKADFNDSARERYLFHLSSYNKIAQGAGLWAEQYETNLFNLILNQSSKSFLLDVEADDMPDVNLEALAAAAAAAATQVIQGEGTTPVNAISTAE
ncbi:hypothetical protein VNI00_017624 [Paramarasmius palmivorus]|uniref:DUF6532 domain-containing protein n=1 Tax=Paramarasmius palmivorus TaxID=297713 RepID=A0AAW0B5N8_9AGAR